jgi:hypothetical protein
MVDFVNLFKASGELSESFHAGLVTGIVGLGHEMLELDSIFAVDVPFLRVFVISLGEWYVGTLILAKQQLILRLVH